MWKKISKTDFSAVSSVSIDNCFSATYTHYLVVRNLTGSADDSGIDIRLRVGGVDATAADYRHQRVDANSTTITGARVTGDTDFQYALGWTEPGVFGFAQCRLSNPFEAVRTTAWSDMSFIADGNIRLMRVVYEHDLTTSYDGLTVYPADGGTITGSITVYGLKES